MRPIKKVQEEVRNGIISIEKAKEDYGVVIIHDTYEVNLEETKNIRGK
jgi:N-methylhydantoinase B